MKFFGIFWYHSKILGPYLLGLLKPYFIQLKINFDHLAFVMRILDIEKSVWKIKVSSDLILFIFIIDRLDRVGRIVQSLTTVAYSTMLT